MKNRIYRQKNSKQDTYKLPSEKSNFTAEKPGRQYFNQVMKVKIINNGTIWKCVSPDR